MERERISGLVLEVTEQNAGATLATDATASDTTLFLDDASFFLDEGGEALIYDDSNSESITYLSADLESDTIELDTGLANSYEAEATVEIVPALPLRYAEFQESGANDDTLRVAVDTVHGLVLPLGTREDDDREQVVVEHDLETDTFVVVEVYSRLTPEDILSALLGS